MVRISCHWQNASVTKFNDTKQSNTEIQLTLSAGAISDINKSDYIEINGNGLMINKMPDYILKSTMYCKVIFSKKRNSWFVI